MSLLQTGLFISLMATSAHAISPSHFGNCQSILLRNQAKWMHQAEEIADKLIGRELMLLRRSLARAKLNPYSMVFSIDDVYMVMDRRQGNLGLRVQSMSTQFANFLEFAEPEVITYMPNGYPLENEPEIQRYAHVLYPVRGEAFDGSEAQLAFVFSIEPRVGLDKVYLKLRTQCAANTRPRPEQEMWTNSANATFCLETVARAHVDRRPGDPTLMN